MEYIEFYSPEIYHHGIQGQKWGVRRYQNEDGSLTEAGKEKMAEIRTKYSKKINSLYDHSNKWSEKKAIKLENKGKMNKAAAAREMIRRNEEAREEKLNNLMKMNYSDFKQSRSDDFWDWIGDGQDYFKANHSNMTLFVSRLREYNIQRGMRWTSNFTFDKTLSRAGSDSDKFDYLRNKNIARRSFRSGYAYGDSN